MKFSIEVEFVNGRTFKKVTIDSDAAILRQTVPIAAVYGVLSAMTDEVCSMLDNGVLEKELSK